MSASNQFKLLTERRFAPFFATQFLGAFNDNVFRNALIIVITFQGITVFDLNASQLANVAGALFILPFFIFSATAGQLADKYEKSGLMRIVKTIEIALMLLAAYAFVRDLYELLFLVLFLMGFQSTLFGPVKYAYLPQKLDNNELMGGNGLVEAGTYLAIIFGLVVGDLAVARDPDNLYFLSACLVAFATAGYFASRAVPHTPPVDPDLVISWNVWRQTGQIVGFARKDRSVFLAIVGISWFWFLGSAITLQIPAYTLDILNGNQAINVVLLIAFSIGVGIGSLLCERLSGHRIELGLVPLGSIGLTVFAIDLYFAQPEMNIEAVTTAGELFARAGSLRVLIDLAMIGAFGGIYSVPLYAMVQERAARQHLSRVIAANNIVNSLFIVMAAMLALVSLNAGLTIPEFFVVVGVLNALFAVCLYAAVPEFVQSFKSWIRNPLSR
ncbi:MAG: MFS transporter [Woeseiaceae bacterium]